MALSFDEYRSRGRDPERQREHIQQLRAVIHEAVRTSAVTGHPDWDHFLARLEGRIKAYETETAAVQAVLCHPGTVNVDKIMEAKIKIVALEASAQALREVIELPRLLIAHGAEASDMLRSVEPETTP